MPYPAVTDTKYIIRIRFPLPISRLSYPLLGSTAKSLPESQTTLVSESSTTLAATPPTGSGSQTTLVSESLTTPVPRPPSLDRTSPTFSESHLRSSQRGRLSSLLHPTDSESRTTLVPESSTKLVSVPVSLREPNCARIREFDYARGYICSVSYPLASESRTKLVSESSATLVATVLFPSPTFSESHLRSFQRGRLSS